MKNNRLKLFLLLFAASVVVSGCTSAPPRLRESGLNSRFAFSQDAPFDEYLRETGRMIERARGDLDEINRDAVLDANRPFELKPDETRFPKNREGRYEKGILLIHGLSDSPYLLKPLARCLQQRGFLVRSILLPGHGTVPGDLLRVSYREWIRAADYGLHQLKARVRNIYVGGFSTGGALCIYEAIQHDEIKGLVLFAPAVGIESRWAFLAGFMSIFRDWLGGEEDDRDYAKYESFAINGGAQLYALTRKIDDAFASGRRIAAPVFTVLTREDISIDTEKMLTTFRRYMTSPKSLLLLYSGEGAAAGNDAKDGRILFRKSSFPEERIVDYAHVSLLIPSDDSHYGREGGYRSCLHYRDDEEKRRVCLFDPKVWKGEITEANLEKHTLRRLTYNPRYDEMIGFLDQFLAGLREQEQK